MGRPKQNAIGLSEIKNAFNGEQPNSSFQEPSYIAPLEKEQKVEIHITPHSQHIYKIIV